jgi:hypothetical protein
LLEGAEPHSKIAVVSTPSVFIQLKNLLAGVETSQHPTIRLLEYDERFAIFKEFIPYDYTLPLKLSGISFNLHVPKRDADILQVDLKGQFDRIICDPPFFNVDCHTKASKTVHWLSRLSQDSESSATRLIVSSGERMREVVMKLYESDGIHTTDLELVHTRGLSNEYMCYANFKSDLWQFIN